MSEKKPTRMKVVPGTDGSIEFEPYEKDDTDPQPAEDGKYYLRGESTKEVDLAWRLMDEGVEVYCAVCKAPLLVTPSFILCRTDEKHYRVMT